jgi:hypothetical protein
VIIDLELAGLTIGNQLLERFVADRQPHQSHGISQTPSEASQDAGMYFIQLFKKLVYH